MSRELVLKTLNHEKTDRVPWVPFAGVHAGYIKGYTAEEMLKNSDMIVESLIEASKLYMPDGLPVVFDLQIEAEILGCELMWARDNPPSVRTHPLEEEKDIPCMCKIPTEESGRIPVILDAMKKVKKEIGNEVALYGLICGPFTLASHLRGNNIFKDMMSDKEYVKELMNFTSQVSCKMAEMYIEAGMDVIAVVDPLISQVSPIMIKKMLLEGFTAVFDFIRSKGAYSSFFVCGNATSQIDIMCKSVPDSISVDENVNMAQAKKITDLYNIAIGGNIPLTTTMLHGTQQDNIKSVIDLLDSIEDKTNMIVSPGCDMPYETPIENTIACSQAVINTEGSRELIKNYEACNFDMDVELIDYSKYEKVIVELFLIDPNQCAACTYMQNSVLDIVDEISEFAEYKIYKYTIKEDIARTMKMGIKNLPSMCIEGEVRWSSIIPNSEELIREIKESYNKKNKK